MTKINKKAIIIFIENYNIQRLMYTLLGFIPVLLFKTETGNLRFVAVAGFLFSMYHFLIFILISLLTIDFRLPNENNQESLNESGIVFESDSDKPNLIAHFLQFGFIITILLYQIKKILFHHSSYIIESFLILIMLLILFFYLKRKNREPSFITISETQITFRSFLYIIKHKIDLKQINGYSFINKPYYTNKGRSKTLHPSYLIYINDNSKKLIISYNYNNFRELNVKLKKSGIKFLGKDESEWSGPRKKYKFD